MTIASREAEYEGDGPVRYVGDIRPMVCDLVRCAGWFEGVVVGVVETSEYLLEKYRGWSFLGGGLLVIDGALGLVVVSDDKKEIYLVKRPEAGCG
jgi:hypothetical protein